MKSLEGSPEQLHWSRPCGSPGKEARDWDSESGALAKDGVTKMCTHVKDQGSARHLAAEAGPGRTARCREVHLESGGRQSHLPVRAHTASLLPCALSPTNLQGVRQPWLRAVVRDKRGLAHRALTRGRAGVYHPSCASVPGPRGERSLPGKPESQREGGDPHNLQQGPRLGLPEASQHGHERETNRLQACECPLTAHLPWGGHRARLQDPGSETLTSEKGI